MKKIKIKNPSLFFFFIAVVFGLIISVYYLVNPSEEKEGASSQNKNAASEESNNSKKTEVMLATPAEAEKAIRNKNYILLDIRPEKNYQNYHIESSINAPYENSRLKSDSLEKDQTVIVVELIPSEKGLEVARQLITNGFETRCLKGGLSAYMKGGFPVISSGNYNSTTDRAKVSELTKEEVLEMTSSNDNIIFLDVRKPFEFNESHIKGAVNIPLEELERRKSELPLREIIVVDEDPGRSFQAAVRLFDMNIYSVYYYGENLHKLKKQEVSNEASKDAAESQEAIKDSDE